MARDAELDRLKAVRQQAYDRKQAAYADQSRAWDVCSRARDAMNRAFEVKQSAYAEQDGTWQYYQRVRSSNGPRIDSLNSQQETAYNNMRNAFDNASRAYECHDGASAKSYSEDGHGYKAESQGCVEERRRLVAEIRSARESHEATKPAFQRARDEYNSCKRTFDAAKAAHERAQAEFKRAKAEFDSVNGTFQTRLERVKREKQQRRDEKRAVAQRAGIPSQYVDNVWVSTDFNGNTNIYFGGVDKPDGAGHGHYVMDRSGTVTYRRDPFDPHGAQNFTSNQADYFDAVRTESISGKDEFGFMCTYKGLPAMVETGYDERTNRQKINIYYGAADGMVGRYHGHAVAYRNEPHIIVSDREPNR